MNTNSSRKRGREESAPKVLNSSTPVNHDVTIIVNGYRFDCLKEELSHHSNYFQRMFNSNFTERNEPEVELGGIVKPKWFYMFLKVVNGENVVTDIIVEKMLELADYLESNTLEANCIHHLGQKTRFSLKQQFQMAETHHSEKLMIQVCSSIKDAYELDQVVPKDLDSFCNTTKNIVMQRSFELLGIRKPPSPPLPEDPDQYFENRLNQIIDQVEIQNHHGEILSMQIQSLLEHLFLEKYLPRLSGRAVQVIRDNPLIKELNDELREAHDHDEANFIQTQILVLKYKDLYTIIQDPEIMQPPSYKAEVTSVIRDKLTSMSEFIEENKRSFRSFRVTLGDREIDRIYRDINEITIELRHEEYIRDVKDNARWFEWLKKINDDLTTRRMNKQGRMQRPMPDGIRQVPNHSNFRTIDEIVSNMRYLHYLVPRVIEPGHNAAPDQGHQHQIIDEHNAQEQDQEGN